MKIDALQDAIGARQHISGKSTYFATESEAVVLRARAEHAKLASLYAPDPAERETLSLKAQAYDAVAAQLEALLLD